MDIVEILKGTAEITFLLFFGYYSGAYHKGYNERIPKPIFKILKWIYDG
jgi:hypothetical protein